jgi:hypothetical protein
MRDLGWSSANRVAAAGRRRQDNGKNRKRIEKNTWVETKTFSTTDSENLITYALGVNALSMHARRQCLAPPPAA